MLAAAVVHRDVHVPALGHGKGSLCLHAEFAHRHAIALEVDLGAIGDGETALLAGDFEAVAARSLASGGDKGGGEAAVVLQHGGDIVFDLDLMETTELAEAADALRHAEHPLEEVQVVRALVHEHAAALALPRATPAAGGVVIIGAEPVGDFPVHAADRAELAAVDEVLHFLEGRVRAHVEHGGEDLLLVRVRGDEALAVRLVHGDGLFDEDMQAGFECLDADGGVAEVRRADQNGVDVAGVDHRIHIGEGVLSFDELRQRADALAEGGDAKSGDFSCANVREVCLAHVAKSNDAESDVF